MTTAPHPDVVVVGGGLVGLATARAMQRRGAAVAVLEAEPAVALHQSGRSSGVIHSGLYYPPGSLKARLCTDGRQALYAFCEQERIPHRVCGKLVVALRDQELPRLDELERRGRANGLAVERLDRGGITAVEPEAAGIAGLLVPETGVVDFPAVARALALAITEAGGNLRTGAKLLGVRRDGAGLVLRIAGGRLECGRLINCAGLQSDRVAALCGAEPGVRIIPFRGDTCELLPAARAKVRALIYPVPDPRFPFLGVHLTRTIHGEVHAGPNAVLALARAGYGRFSFSPADALGTLAWPGFWRLARRTWRNGATELRRAFSHTAFTASLRELVPSLAAGDLRRAGCGVRAQAVDRDGNLVDDFRIVESERAIHVLNAPSPAATACLAIGEEIAARLASTA